MSTVRLPRRASPFTEPSGQAFGRREEFDLASVLCRSISAMPAVPPKLHQSGTRVGVEHVRVGAVGRMRSVRICKLLGVLRRAQSRAATRSPAVRVPRISRTSSPAASSGVPRREICALGRGRKGARRGGGGRRLPCPSLRAIPGAGRLADLIRREAGASGGELFAKVRPRRELPTLERSCRTGRMIWCPSSGRHRCWCLGWRSPATPMDK